MERVTALFLVSGVRLGSSHSLGALPTTALFTEPGCHTLHLTGEGETHLGDPRLWDPRNGPRDFPSAPRESPRKSFYAPAGNLCLVCPKVILDLPPSPSKSLGWHSPMALATTLTRFVISSSPTPASARAPATCPPTDQRKESVCCLWREGAGAVSSWAEGIPVLSHQPGPPYFGQNNAPSAFTGHLPGIF